MFSNRNYQGFLLNVVRFLEVILYINSRGKELMPYEVSVLTAFAVRLYIYELFPLSRKTRLGNLGVIKNAMNVRLQEWLSSSCRRLGMSLKVLFTGTSHRSDSAAYAVPSCRDPVWRVIAASGWVCITRECMQAFQVWNTTASAWWWEGHSKGPFVTG